MIKKINLNSTSSNERIYDKFKITDINTTDKNTADINTADINTTDINTTDINTIITNMKEQFKKNKRKSSKKNSSKKNYKRCLPKIELNENISSSEIREFLTCLEVITNRNAPIDLLKYIYISIVYENININIQKR